MRYALALAAASVLGPVLALFGLAAFATGAADLSSAFLPLMLFVVALYAVPTAALLAAVDSLVLRAFRRRFSRPVFALAMVAAGLAAGAAVAAFLSPDHRLAENMAIFLRLGGSVALLWAVLRPAPKEAEPAHG